MKVLVTGATGYIGPWLAKAAQDNGHDVRLLVRDPAKLDRTAGAIGVRCDDVVEGDMQSASDCDRALDGCEAAIHAAAIVSMERSQAEKMITANTAGATNIVGGAVERGMRAIHVSSPAALRSDRHEVVTAFDALEEKQGGYAASKAAAERYVRSLQAKGAPIAITYPGTAFGPMSGSQAGAQADGVVTILKSGKVPCKSAQWSIVDVRDFAAIHSTLLGRPPSTDPTLDRFIMVGARMSSTELAGHLAVVTGREIRSVAAPGALLRFAGRCVDAASAVFPIHSALTHEAMVAYTQAPAYDDTTSVTALGATYRDVVETLGSYISGLYELGYIDAETAGAATATSGY